MITVSYLTIHAAAELALIEDLSIFSPFAPLAPAQAEAARLNHCLWLELEAVAITATAMAA